MLHFMSRYIFWVRICLSRVQDVKQHHSLRVWGVVHQIRISYNSCQIETLSLPPKRSESGHMTVKPKATLYHPETLSPTEQSHGIVTPTWGAGLEMMPPRLEHDAPGCSAPLKSRVGKFFCEEIGNKHFRFCKPRGRCYSYVVAVVQKQP